MRAAFLPEHEAFRTEVQGFIKRVFPTPPNMETDGQAIWDAALIDKGWQAYKWPEEFGGTGWNVVEKFIWETETGLHNLPAQIHGSGVSMIGPILCGFGTDEQRKRFLPGILNAKDNWCQGYSEPGAGSDLASLGTRAVRDGDCYRVTGQKIWTSGAHRCNWMFALVRTREGGKKQAGITFLLIDMTDPGISVSPIISIDGYHSLNAVSLDDVAVPFENRIGKENAGWTVAKGLLTHERTGLAFVPLSRQKLDCLRRESEFAGLLDEPAFASKLASIETEFSALATLELRVLADTASGEAPGNESSLLKLKGTQILQRITELLSESTGNYGVPYPLGDNGKPALERPGPRYAALEQAQYLIARSASIAGGSDEVQYDIIAKHVLGL